MDALRGVRMWLNRGAGSLRGHSSGVALIAGVVGPLGVAALMVPFRANFASPAAALVLVAVVVAVAIWGSRTAGIIAALGASVWFDFFLTRPYEQLAISHRSDLETAISLVVVGLIVTELAARARHHRDRASVEAEHLALIYEMTSLVASGVPASAVIERVRVVLITLLGLRDCRFESTPAGRRRATMRPDGEVGYGATLWAVNSMGLPERGVDLPVENGGHGLGRFVLTPTPGEPVPLEPRLVAVALAAQVGSALAVRALATG